MKDLLIIADSIIHVNFFGLVLNVPKELANGYLALDSDEEHSVYGFSEEPTKIGSIWVNDTDLKAYPLIAELRPLIEQIGLTEWPDEISSRCYKVQDLILHEGATHP